METFVKRFSPCFYEITHCSVSYFDHLKQIQSILWDCSGVERGEGHGLPFFFVCLFYDIIWLLETIQ